MRMDSEMNDILHLDFMHYMIVASLEMSDEPFFCAVRCDISCLTDAISLVECN